MPAMNPHEVYERNPEYTGREEQFRLRPHEWEFYLRLDGRRTVQEIGDARKLELQWLVPTVQRLLDLKLIRAVEIDMEEFYKRFVREERAEPAAAPVAAATAATVTPAPIAGASAAPVVETRRLCFSLRRSDGATSRPARLTEPAAAAPRNGPMPIPALAPTVEEFHLKPLLDFIISQSGGSTVGQLAAYRVFLKVPNDLLRQAGIRSLNLVDADFTIRDPILTQSLLAAVEEVLGKPYVAAPPSRAAAVLPAAPLRG